MTWEDFFPFLETSRLYQKTGFDKERKTQFISSQKSHNFLNPIVFFLSFLPSFSLFLFPFFWSNLLQIRIVFSWYQSSPNPVPHLIFFIHIFSHLFLSHLFLIIFLPHLFLLSNWSIKPLEAPIRGYQNVSYNELMIFKVSIYFFLPLLLSLSLFCSKKSGRKKLDRKKEREKIENEERKNDKGKERKKKRKIKR